MCGISGSLEKTFSGHESNLARVQAMGRTLEHRGPDHFGTWAGDEFACAHNRLSLVDLTDRGNQPFVDARGVLVYNGEIYNFRQLRAMLETKLGSDDARLGSFGDSDTAVLFCALGALGVEETLESIQGMFAFAYFDRAERKLYLCRDRFGIKPLHYTTQNGGLFFASEVKALSRGLNIELDPIKTLFSIASHGDHSKFDTVFRGVNNLPPGHFLTCLPGESPQLHQYFDLAQSVDPDRYRELDKLSFPEVVDQFDQLLESSVGAMLIADAKVGAFVSGGVDSSLIAAMAQARSPLLFTSNVLGRHSEFADAQRLSSSLELELRDDRFEPDMLLDGLAACTWHYEVPLVRHSNAVPFASVSALAQSSGVKAVLTGEGSDELFYGYPKLLARDYSRALAAPVNAMKSVYGLVPRLREFVFPTPGSSIYDFLGLLTQSYERQRVRSLAAPRFDFLTKKEFPDHYLALQQVQEGLVALLLRNDRMGMKASLESRFPFLHEDVVAFAVNLPTRFKKRWSRSFHNYKHPFRIDKAVVRASGARHLSSALAYKVKNGFPMYGLNSLNIDTDLFRGGYVQELLQLQAGTLKHLEKEAPGYFLGKLLAVEVFGRLFERGDSTGQISEEVKRHVKVLTH